MSKFSHKQGGKENGPASVYAKPHDMKGNPVDGQSEHAAYSREYSVKDAPLNAPIASGVSFGKSMTVKDSGIEMRGTGCATKGKMSRGPMA